MRHTTIFLFFFISLSGFSQTNSNTNVPCTDAIAQNSNGAWMKLNERFSDVNQVQKQEVNNRIDILHNLLLKMYPKPVGVDVRVSRGASKSFFGATRRYSFNQDNALSFDYTNTLPITSISYFANFSPHYCAHTNKGVVFAAGKTNENSDGVSLSINDLGVLADGPSQDDDWTINGLPVRRLSTVVTEKWKGYELYGDIRGSSRLILIHREGMLPYIPVTRKQYLDRCIVFTTRLHDKIIAGARQMPVRSVEEQEKEKKAKLDKFQKQFANDEKKLKANVDYYLSQYKTDQQVRDERVEKAKEIKGQELKVFTDELEKTTRENLLDSPAIILAMYYTVPSVFETDPQKGNMLITENPDYIRRNLAGHVPQFMVLHWKWNPDMYLAQKPYIKRLLEDFPIEKLQAMIDK